MNHLSLTVDIRLGCDIADACRDAVAFANRVGITVKFKLNGVTCIVHPEWWERKGHRLSVSPEMWVE